MWFSGEYATGWPPLQLKRELSPPHFTVQRAEKVCNVCICVCVLVYACKEPEE